MMSKAVGQGSTPAVPCALHRYLPHGHAAQPLATLSHFECQREFQYWVTCTRTASSAISSEISPKEHLMCPLLWCRTSFKDLASILHHVSSCPWLSDGWYWCPLCCRPERFTTTEATLTATPPAVDLGKETKFKRAVSFFKTLGRRRDGRSRSSLPHVINTSLYTNTTAYIGNQKFELGDTSYNPTSPMELDSGKIHELGDEVQCVTPGSSTANHTQYASSTRSPDSWEDESLATTPPYSPPTVASESPVVGVDAQSRTSRCLTDMPNLGNQALMSPVSLTRGSSVPSEKNAGGSPVNLMQLISPSTNSSPSQSTPHLLGNHQLRVGDISSSPPLVYGAEESPSKQVPATTQVQIGDLCEAVRAMIEELIQRLATIIDITLPCSESFARALVEIGFRALRNFLRGTIPSSFQDVFALMHVAGASAYIIHKDDHLYSWDAFLAEIPQWQHLLSDEIEKITFVKVISRLCCPQGFTTSSHLLSDPTDDTFLSAESAVLQYMLTHLPSATVDAALREQDHEGLDQLTESYKQTSSYKKLRKGAIIKACTNLLDTFEYTIIVEDSAERHAAATWYGEQHVHNISMMDYKKKIITERLQDHVSRDGFEGAVDTKVNVRGGLQRNVRELEVTLMSAARSFSKPGQPLVGYLDVVNSLCDEAMQDVGENWRDGFYALALNTALMISFQLNKGQGYISSSPPFTPQSRHNDDTRVRGPRGATTSHRAANNIHSTSAHTLLPPSLTPSEEGSYCPYPSCLRPFTGSSQRENLNRHVKTALHHNRDALYKCELCQKTFSRTDNLRAHLRNIHKVDPPLTRKSTRSHRGRRDTGV